MKSLFNKVASLQACNFIKKRLQHRCFLVNFAKILRAPILKNICERLHLSITKRWSICWSQSVYFWSEQTNVQIKWIKGPLSGLRQFPTIESPLKIMKNAFYFILKALFVLEIFTYFSWLFGYIEKRLNKKALVDFKICGVTDWTRNNYNTHISYPISQEVKPRRKWNLFI